MGRGGVKTFEGLVDAVGDHSSVDATLIGRRSGRVLGSRGQCRYATLWPIRTTPATRSATSPNWRPLLSFSCSRS